MKKFLLKVFVLCMALCLSAGVFAACGSVEFKVNFVVDNEVYATVGTGGSEAIKMPANPEKEGYTFDGWFWDKDVWTKPFTANSLLDAPLSSDMSVYAKFLSNAEYSVTFETNGGTEVEQIRTNRIATAPQTEKDGCFFVGWYTDEDLNESTKVTFPFEVTADTTFYAKWEVLSTVTFETNGGTSVAPITAKVITQSPETARDYNTFIGWYTDISLNESTKVTFPFEVTADVTFYAKWTINYSDGLQFAYQTTSNSYFITGYTGIESQLILPDTYNGVAVTGVSARALEGNSMITEVYIPDSIVTVGLGAFSECYSLEKVVMSSNLQLLGSSAFSNCIKLKEINLPDTLINIGGEAFFGCTKLESLYLSSQLVNIGTNIIRGCNSLKSLTMPGQITLISLVGDSLDNIPKTLEKVTVAKGSVTVVGSAFYNCDFIKELTIAETVKSIGAYAFYGCGGLTELTLPASVETLNDYALAGLNNVENITCKAKNLSDLEEGNHVFNGMGSNTEGVTIIFDGCERIPANMLCSENQKITKIIVNANVLSIAQGAFKNCESLIEMEIPFAGEKKDNTDNTFVKYIFGASAYDEDEAYFPSNLQKIIYIGKTISEYAFAALDKEIEIVISDSVTDIKEYAFKNSVCKVSWGENPSVTAIISNAFADYKGSSITIPDSVTSIGQYAFAGCSSLTSITIPFVKGHFGYIFGAGSYLYNSSYVPASLKTVVVTGGNSIGGVAFAFCSSLTSITIPDSVTSIGSQAFFRCLSLKNIVIPDSVTSIEGGVFEECKGLTSITIPDSVTSIGKRAFYNCSSLTSVTIGNSVTSIEYFAFYNCNSLTSITISDSVTSIGSSAFEECSGLTSVTIGNSVTSIGGEAFRGCSNLTSVTIGNSVTSIEYCAFYNCSSLTTITIPDSVTSIGNDAFSNCSGLTSVTIGNSVISIGERAFSSCSSLTSITIPDSVTSIGEYAFYECSTSPRVIYGGTIDSWCEIDFGTGSSNPLFRSANLYIEDVLVTEANIKAGTKINPYAFYGYTALTNITIGNSVTSIGRYAFAGCTALEDIAIPDSVTSIGDRVFYNCTGLNSAIIGNSVTSIGEYAFSGCTALDDITIPDSVTSIGNYAFNECTGLNSAIIGNSVTSIGEYAFYECSGLTSAIIGNSVKSIGDSAFAYCSALTSVTIGNSVISIGERAFSGCSSLTSITIPDSVKSIGKYAFSSCGLSFVNFNTNTEISFGEGVFYNATKIAIVIYEGSVNLVSQCSLVKTAKIIKPSSIVSDALYEYSGKILLKYKGSEENIVINREQFSSIAPWAFKDNTSIKSVTVGENVEIMKGAFAGCNNIESFSLYVKGSDYSFGNIFGVSNGMVSENLKTITINVMDEVLESQFVGLKYVETIYLNGCRSTKGPFSGCNNLTKVYYSGSPCYNYATTSDSHYSYYNYYFEKITNTPENVASYLKEKRWITQYGWKYNSQFASFYYQ